MSTPAYAFDSFSKADLRILADRLREPDSEAVAQCVAFVEAETLRVGHGRARARISRRLKHCPLTDGQRDRLVQVILQRLASGRFAQQFKDQLRLALYLDAVRVNAVARNSRAYADSDHVRRYAAWLLAHPRCQP